MGEQLTAEQIMAHWRLLVGVVKRVLPRASYTVWEDLAGDTVERAIRNAHRYQERGDGPTGWLCTMAARIALDHQRRAQNRTEALPLEEWTPNTATVDAGCTAHVDRIDLRAAVDALPADLAAFAAVRIAGLGPIEAGAQMGLSKSTSSRRESGIRALLAPRLLVTSEPSPDARVESGGG